MAQQSLLPPGDYWERLTGEVAESEVVWPERRPI
jgi:hypothetical protein